MTTTPETDKATTLRWTRDAKREMDSAQAEILTCVSHARRAGASWAEIGDALGMSKQAAQQKFGKLTPAPEQPTVLHWACDVCTWTIAYAPENKTRGLDTIAEHVKTHTDEDYLKAATVLDESPAAEPAIEDIYSGKVNTAGERLDWITDPKNPRPKNCPYCAAKKHVIKQDRRKFWIYPGCSITKADQEHYETGITL